MILLLACTAELADPLAPARTGVDLTLDEKHVLSGEPLVVKAQVTAPADWQVAGPMPGAEGLTAELIDQQTREIGDRVVVTHIWALTGADGSYHLPGGAWTFTDPDGREIDVEGSSLFADIGVDGPSSELAGLAAMPMRETPPYGWYAAAGVSAALALAGLVWWRKREKPVPPPPPPIPPDVEALAAWAAVLDSDLDDHGRALALSALFRNYLERRTGLAATTLTKQEILDSGVFNPELQRATKRLLTATDLIKFARDGGGAELFEELDLELRLVIRLTTSVAVT